MRSLASVGLPTGFRILDTASRRLPQAYPIYTRNYSQHFDCIDQWLNSVEGLVTFGRQGLFAHDNTHHALAMAYALNDCVTDSGTLDRAKWAAHRHAFQQHVVED
jgi:protoporphyrinogen oxidase